MKINHQLRKIIPLILITSSCFIIDVNIESVECEMPTDGLKILYLLADDFTNSYYYMYPGLLEEYGFDIYLAGPTELVYDMYNNEYEMDYTFDNLTITDFVAIMILGGSQDYPSNLGDIPEAMTLIQNAYSNGLVLFAHDEVTVALADAGIISGRNVTCTEEIHSEVLAAGANILDEPIVIDGQLVTTKTYTGGFQSPIGIIKALDLMEYNAPTIDDLIGEVLVESALGSVSIEVTVSDEFAVDNLKVQFSSYSESLQQFVIQSEYQMTGNNNKTIFSFIVHNLVAGNYTVNIITTDIFGNNETYSDQFRFLIGESRTTVYGLRNLSLFLIIGFSISIITVTTRRSKKMDS